MIITMVLTFFICLMLLLSVFICLYLSNDSVQSLIGQDFMLSHKICPRVIPGLSQGWAARAIFDQSKIMSDIIC